MRKLVFSLATFGIVASTIIMLFRMGHPDFITTDKVQLSIKTILDYIASYDGFEAFERLIYLSNEAVDAFSEIILIWDDGIQWADILSLLQYLLLTPVAGILYFITILVNLIIFLLDSIMWILGLFELLI